MKTLFKKTTQVRNKPASQLRYIIESSGKTRLNTKELILISARTVLTEPLIIRARQLMESGVDWFFFKLFVTRNGITFPCYNALTRINAPDLVPEWLIDNLRLAHLSAVAGAVSQHKETEALLKMFYEKDIPAVPLKGTFLSKRLYGDVAYRRISKDIDIFIESKNREAGWRVLEEGGYSFVPEEGTGGRLGQALFRKPNATDIDLHWEINPIIPNKRRVEEFWKGVRIDEEDSFRHYELKEEELLLQLVAHLVDSVHLTQIRYACDIHELLAKYKDRLDWADITEKAKRWRLSNSLYAALILDREVFGSRHLEDVLAELRPGLFKRLFINAFAAKRAVLDAGSRRRSFMKRFLKYVLFQLLEAASFKEYLVILFPPKKEMGTKTYLKRIVRGVGALLNTRSQ